MSARAIIARISAMLGMPLDARTGAGAAGAAAAAGAMTLSSGMHATLAAIPCCVLLRLTWDACCCCARAGRGSLDGARLELAVAAAEVLLATLRGRGSDASVAAAAADGKANLDCLSSFGLLDDALLRGVEAAVGLLRLGGRLGSGVDVLPLLRLSGLGLPSLVTSSNARVLPCAADEEVLEGGICGECVLDVRNVSEGMEKLSETHQRVSIQQRETRSLT